MLPNRKYRLMPQAIVPSGRKWPDSLSVTEPRMIATSAVSTSPAISDSHGEVPAKASQPGSSCDVVSHALVVGAEAHEGPPGRSW